MPASQAQHLKFKTQSRQKKKSCCQGSLLKREFKLFLLPSHSGLDSLQSGCCLQTLFSRKRRWHLHRIFTHNLPYQLTPASLILKQLFLDLATLFLLGSVPPFGPSLLLPV
jgi:hypothetical protein